MVKILTFFVAFLENMNFNVQYVRIFHNNMVGNKRKKG